MDHDQAIQTQASMRYALGELTAPERDSFEEHFADCSFCLKDLEASMALSANARAVFCDKASSVAEPRRFAWLPWRPSPVLALSAALNLMLVAGLGYELRRVRPEAVDGLAGSLHPQSVAVVAIRGAMRGSAGSEQVVRTPRREIVLTFDLPQSYQHYLYSIEQAGNTVMSGEVTITGQPDSLNLEIPAYRLAAGEYRITLTGSSASGRETLGKCLLQVEPK